jgi:hypothetical protein
MIDSKFISVHCLFALPRFPSSNENLPLDDIKGMAVVYAVKNPIFFDVPLKPTLHQTNFYRTTQKAIATLPLFASTVQ